MTFGNDATDRGTGTTRFGMDRVVGAIERLEWLLPEEHPTLACQAAPLCDGRLLAALSPTANHHQQAFFFPARDFLVTGCRLIVFRPKSSLCLPSSDPRQSNRSS